ncbi:efflux RND transporter periplasmic adaptor subunit [uncultured Hyphomonas sp.]|uniref:efflux RND transporter periplasmic adaptor subunit n=1 Tax=uncultured Hyphomonas sp. TaxID=225298 RepID=UPI000C5AF38A|nr:efflux transporter periplasmic adaptor subunit [Hyphomonadaceae bacterium]|tara:strand:+ start:48916 stop:50100 length:1185 start_codon:yes stop_codon:yes gene_type:complete
MTEIHHTTGDTARDKRPTALKGLFFLIILLLVCVGLVFAAAQLRSKEGPKVAKTAPVPMAVQVAPVELVSAFTLNETYSGLAEARRNSALGFSSGGRIETIAVDVGDRVKRGSILASLDTRGLRAQLASASAVVDEARAAHSLALSTVERRRTLKLQGHVSQQAVDEAEAQANTALARVEAAKAQADIFRVQIDLSRITAPFDGVVTARMSDEGAIAGAGQPILDLVEAAHLEARIGLPANSAARLVPGDAYTLQADTGAIEAVLRSVTGVIDPAQRTVAAVFEINDAEIVASGAVVRLTMERDIDEPGFWVPVKALSTASRGLWTIYVAEPTESGWHVASRPVEMVHTDGDRAFVRGAVTAGERVITDGLQRIVPGQPVEPRDAHRASTVNGG